MKEKEKHKECCSICFEKFLCGIALLCLSIALFFEIYLGNCFMCNCLIISMAKHAWVNGELTQLICTCYIYIYIYLCVSIFLV